MLIFTENEGDSRKLKKEQELVQRFNEQCRDVPRENLSIDKNLINYEEEKRK